MNGWWLLATVASLLLLALAAWRDILTRLIPDPICIALAALGLAVRGSAGLWAALSSVGTAAALFALLALVHARGLLGGGDVKLMTAIVVQFPPGQVLRMLLAISIAGGALAALYIALRRLPAPARCAPGARPLRRLWTVERWRVHRGSLPYGVAIACGGAWAFLLGRGF